MDKTYLRSSFLFMARPAAASDTAGSPKVARTRCDQRRQLLDTVRADTLLLWLMARRSRIADK